MVVFMTNEEKILHALEHLQADVNDLKHGQQQQGVTITRLEHGQEHLLEGQKRLEQSQARTNTVLKVLEAGQNDIRENMATKADVQDTKAEHTKLKRRIENLEEQTKTPNPQKH